MKNISAIIKTFERPKAVRRLIDSIRKYYPDLPIIVADDSAKGTRLEDVEYYRLPYDCGISYGRNYMLRRVKTRFVLLLDDDYLFTQATKIEELLDILKNNSNDIVGGVLENEKGAIEEYYGNVIREEDTLLYKRDYYKEKEKYIANAI